jgi:hypothetical protein
MILEMVIDVFIKYTWILKMMNEKNQLINAQKSVLIFLDFIVKNKIADEFVLSVYDMCHLDKSIIMNLSDLPKF